jgi:hypothetical protein
MRLHHADQHLEAFLLALARGTKHGVRLAHACGCAEVHAQFPTTSVGRLLLELSQQRVGSGLSRSGAGMCIGNVR